MDFKIITEKLTTAFQSKGIKYALIGGFAAGLWGVGRSTVDIDFLIDRDDLAAVDAVMTGLGYECKYKSENVSQYISPLKVMGEVDFLHAFRRASREMLDRAVEKEIFGGSFTIKVLVPSDIIGLKVQSMTNDPSRTAIDMADIESLLSIQKDNVDWTIIEDYFKLFDRDEIFHKLKDKYK